MSFEPQSVEQPKITPRDQIVSSGIAERMLASIKNGRGTQDAAITASLRDCDFRVEKMKDDLTDRMLTQVVIDMPNPNPLNLEKTPRVSLAFLVEPGKPFGSADETPLTPDQLDLVMKLAR